MMQQLDIHKNDKIAICGQNMSNWAIAFMAIADYEGVAVSILPDFTGEDIQKLVLHSDAKLLFVGPVVERKLDFSQFSQLHGIISLRNFDLLWAQNESYKEAFMQSDVLFKNQYPHAIVPTDLNLPIDNADKLLLINYTSGTTSQPKGVMLSYGNLSANVDFGQRNIPNQAGWSMVSMLPLAHMFGLMYECLYQLAGGCHVYFLGKTPTPAILLKAFSEIRPYMVLTVPLVIEKICRKNVIPAIQRPFIKLFWNMPIIGNLIKKSVRKKMLKVFGGKLQHLIVGGAALNKDVEKLLKQIHFPYLVGYGMTECAPLIAYAPWTSFKRGSCGRPVDCAELKIDSSSPQKEVGEILVKGANVMMGYYKNEEATQAAFTADGWLKTGDLGTFDKNQNLFIRGRNKNMILSASGQNIYPEEIEDKLNSMEGVVESVVVEREGKLVGLVFPEWEKEGRAEMLGRTIKELMNENLEKLNKALPNFSKVSTIELVQKEFEKTPKKSIKRFLYK